MITPQEVIAICVSYRGMQPRTRKVLASWVKMGGGLLLVDEGANPVDLARNIILTRAVKEIAADSPRTVALLVDDDMDPTVAEMLEVADCCKKFDAPCSAAYCDDQEQLLARHRRSELGGLAYWETGLGLFALAVADLRRLAACSPVVEHFGQELICFCWTGPSCDGPPTWWNEDQCLCWRLATEIGAPPLLVPVIVDHLRIRGIRPSFQGVLDAIAASKGTKGTK